MSAILQGLASACIAVIVTLASPAAVAQIGERSCSDVRDELQVELDGCWFMARNEPDEARREKEENLCEIAQDAANRIIRWCNTNISLCEDNLVSYTLDINQIFNNVDWNVECYY